MYYFQFVHKVFDKYVNMFMEIVHENCSWQLFIEIVHGHFCGNFKQNMFTVHDYVKLQQT